MGDDLSAQYNQPLGPNLDALILPEVKFRNSDLPGALRYLAAKAKTQSGGLVRVQFVTLLPEDFKPRAELTLDLQSISFSQALQFLGQLAGINFTQGPHAIIARLHPPPREHLPPVQVLQFYVPAETILNDPARPVTTANNIYYSLSGQLEREKSGYIKHRGLDGGPVDSGPAGSGLDITGAGSTPENEQDNIRTPPRSGLVITGAGEGPPNHPASPPGKAPAVSPVIGDQLDSAEFANVNFEKLPLSSCLESLRQSAATFEGRNAAINFFITPGVNASQPITLHLRNTPLLEVLRYLTAVSGAQFSLGQYAINVKPNGPGLGLPEPVTPAETTQLNSIRLPDLELNHTPLDNVMTSLERTIQSNSTLSLCFVTQPGLDTSAPVNLNLTNIPLTEALVYIGELAHVDFIIERHAIWAMPKGD